MAYLTEMAGNPDNADPRMDPEKNPVPFDGERMISANVESLLTGCCQ